MKVFTVVFVVVLAIAAASAGDGDIMDEIDFDAMIQDDSQRRVVLDCLLDKVPCGDMQKIKDVIPKLIETKCGQCTPQQKEKYDRASEIMKEKYPEDFNAVMSKYGPKPQ